MLSDELGLDERKEVAIDRESLSCCEVQLIRSLFEVRKLLKNHVQAIVDSYRGSFSVLESL